MKKTLFSCLFLVLCFVFSNPNIATVGAENQKPIDSSSGLLLDDNNLTVSTLPDSISSGEWTKYVDNPVLTVGSTDSWDSDSVNFPTVLFRNGLYSMWYAGNQDSNDSIRIGLATSPDGVNWTKHQDNPVFTVGDNGSWDSGFVSSPYVIYHDGIYKMWYRGTDEPGLFLDASIGYATSTDGINWEKYSGNPVLTTGPDFSWESTRLFSVCVIVDGDTYKMWYSGSDGNNHRIGYATSPDGINWTKYSGNPVVEVGPSGSWDSKYAYYPNVVHNGNVYEMWYTGYNGSKFGIGHATSTDGINWDKDTDNPIITPEIFWEGKRVLESSVIIQGGFYKMWYVGADITYKDQIGYATASLPIKYIYLPIVLH